MTLGRRPRHLVTVAAAVAVLTALAAGATSVAASTDTTVPADGYGCAESTERVPLTGTDDAGDDAGDGPDGVLLGAGERAVVFVNTADGDGWDWAGLAE